VKQHRAASDSDYESWREDEVTPTLNAMDNTSDSFATVIAVTELPIAFNWQNGGGYGNANDGLAITTDGVGPLSVSQVPAVSVQEEPPRYVVRRLTPTECERLQGFPDGWTDVPGPKGKPQADSQRYRQLGNAITVPVAHYIACLLIDADARLPEPSFISFDPDKD
jgi:site-specific DNA-cytosine methylase